MRLYSHSKQDMRGKRCWCCCRSRCLLIEPKQLVPSEDRGRGRWRGPAWSRGRGRGRGTRKEVEGECRKGSVKKRAPDAGPALTGRCGLPQLLFMQEFIRCTPSTPLAVDHLFFIRPISPFLVFVRFSCTRIFSIRTFSYLIDSLGLVFALFARSVCAF